MGLFCKKCWNLRKRGHFQPNSFLMQQRLKFSPFSHFSAFFAKQSHKMDKIWSLEDEMRKFFGQKFWSHGTPLGSLGSLSQGDVSLWFDWHYFLVIWGPCDHPVIVALHAQAEILKTAGAWCEEDLCFHQDYFQISFFFSLFSMHGWRRQAQLLSVYFLNI